MKRFLAAIAIVSAVPAASQTSDTARAFGVRESIESAALSPDGSKLVYVGPTVGQGSAIYVVKLGGTAPSRIAGANGKPERIDSCRWASNVRLLCNIYGVSRVDGVLVYTNRVVAMNDDGSKMMVLRHDRGTGAALGYATFGGSVIDWNPGEDGQVLMIRQYVEEGATGSRLGQSKAGFGVDMVDTMSLKTRAVEQPDQGDREFFTDGRGAVRLKGRVEMAVGRTTGERRYLYRRKGKSGWDMLSTVDAEGNGFDPYGVDPTLDVAYGLKRVDGRMAAFSKALDGSGTEKLVYAHPSVDVSGFARIGRNGRIIGAVYATDVQAVEYFDPGVAKLVRMLAGAVKLPLIRVVDSNEDESRMLVWAGSDVDPGRYFLFDRQAQSLNELMLARPQLEKVTLSPTRAITYPAADGTAIPGYLTLPAGGGKGLPAIVLPHGGPSARDHWGFDWLAQYYASQGFAVLQPNFRGSAGYGDAWFQKNGFQSWQVAVGDVNDAGRWLVKQGIADPARLGIVGWSYGGYAALQSAATEPGLFKRVVAIAPVTDLDRLKRDALPFTNAGEIARFVGSGPHIEQGSPERHAAKIKAPVLLFHGDMDRNVGITHARQMHDKLKAAGVPSELVVFDGLDHYLDDSDARATLLQRSAAFLKAP